MALSDFYLDTTLQGLNFRYIARTVLASPYSLNETKRINQHEVFPVLHSNLLSVAGEWSGFDEAWLANEIIASLNKRSFFRALTNKATYILHQQIIREPWKKLEDTYYALHSALN